MLSLTHTPETLTPSFVSLIVMSLILEHFILCYLVDEHKLPTIYLHILSTSMDCPSPSPDPTPLFMAFLWVHWELCTFWHGQSSNSWRSFKSHGTLQPDHFLFLCECVHVCPFSCVCTCIVLCMQVEVRGQPQVSFFRHHPLFFYHHYYYYYFEARFPMLWDSPYKLDWQAGQPARPRDLRSAVSTYNSGVNPSWTGIFNLEPAISWLPWAFTCSDGNRTDTMLLCSILLYQSCWLES